MAIKTNDIFGIGILLISIFILVSSWSIENIFIRFSGIIGSTILIIVELMLLYKFWNRK